MIDDLAGLIAPLPVADFRAQLRRREPLAFRASGDVSALLDWDGFITAALDPRLPARRLSVLKAGARLPELFYRANGLARADVIEGTMSVDGSVVAYNAQHCVPALDRLCAAIAAETGEHVIAALVGSIGNHSAYDLHYDAGDVLVVQVEGSKRWIVQADPAIDPVPGAAQVPGDPVTPTLIDTVLHPGDLLLVPAGYRHHCTMTGERSLHISVMFFPLTAARVADLLVRELLDEPLARRPVRCDPDEHAAAEVAIKRLLVERIEAMTLDELRSRHRDTLLPQGGRG